MVIKRSKLKDRVVKKVCPMVESKAPNPKFQVLQISSNDQNNNFQTFGNLVIGKLKFIWNTWCLGFGALLFIKHFSTNNTTNTSLRRSRPHSLIFSKATGLSLVEILVAIAISIVTMTSSAVFAASLVQRGQQNFMETSAYQLQTIVMEQLRLLENAMRKDTRNKDLAATDAYLYDPSASAQPWTEICAQTSIAKFFSISNDDTNKVVKVSAIPNSAPSYDVDNTTYYFYQIPETQEADYGGFSGTTTEVLMSVMKTYVSSSDIGEYISFMSVIGYKLYGKYYFTKPLETRMIRSLICK